MIADTYKVTAALFAAVVASAVLATSCGTANSDVEAGVERVASFRAVTLPVGTVLHLQLRSGVGSDTSRVEDSVSADLIQAVTINGRDVVSAGSTVSGLVSAADDSNRVKGRAQLSLRFTSLRQSGRDYDIQTSGFSRTAPATKSEDATKIGVGAGIGAAVGAVLGGKKGAAEGAAIGGGAGTGLVLATRGEEVRLGAGTDITTRLTAPVTIRVAN
ncbi:MAG: hypothetical protein ABL986_13465 [Vicinamibacterales bacterium]